MWPTLKPSQRVAVVGAVNPQSTNAVQTTAWIDMSQFESALAIIAVGAISAGGLIDAQIQQAQDNAGTGAKAVQTPQGVNKSITEIVAAGQNVQALINVRASEIDTNNGYRFIQLSITPSVAAALISGQVLGLDPKYGVASDHAAATQTQII